LEQPVPDLETFPIFQVDDLPERREPIGSKTKFWFRRPDGLWLFKQARDGTGEAWAEKIAAEIADCLGLPHARVELAQCGAVIGVATLDFTSEAALGNLVHGNELLFETDPDYPRMRGYRVQEHTLDAVRRVLNKSEVGLPQWRWPAGVETPWDAFLGYLLLDALICNTDRHHQNWGALVQGGAGQVTRTLAPTFDHASSLGRELTDEERHRRLNTRDKRGNLEAYVANARSALHDASGRRLGTTAAFENACAMSAAAGEAWLTRFRSILPETYSEIVSRVPGQTMSAPGRDFALGLLGRTRSQLEVLGA
jgi:hypothetical protein